MNADTYDLRDRLTPAWHRARQNAPRSFPARLEGSGVSNDAGFVSGAPSAKLKVGKLLRKGVTIVSRTHRLEYVVVEVTSETVTLRRKGVKLDPLMPFRGLTKIARWQFEAHMEAKSDAT